jgi:hypothetical protein
MKSAIAPPASKGVKEQTTFVRIPTCDVPIGQRQIAAK